MIEWQLKRFEELTTKLLFDVYQLRQQVFVLEQQCLYPDIDSKDLRAIHLLGHDKKNDKLCAYMRIIEPLTDDNSVALGRIVTASAYRGTGLGKILLEEGIHLALQLHPGCNIKISAQAHLEKFYQQAHFVTCSEPYDEDGISHIDMIRYPSK